VDCAVIGFGTSILEIKIAVTVVEFLLQDQLNHWNAWGKSWCWVYDIRNAFLQYAQIHFPKFATKETLFYKKTFRNRFTEKRFCTVFAKMCPCGSMWGKHIYAHFSFKERWLCKIGTMYSHLRSSNLQSRPIVPSHFRQQFLIWEKHKVIDAKHKKATLIMSQKKFYVKKNFKKGLLIKRFTK